MTQIKRMSQKLLIAFSVILVVSIIIFYTPQHLFDSLSKPEIIVMQLEKNGVTSQITISNEVADRFFECISGYEAKRTLKSDIPAMSSDTYLHTTIQDGNLRYDIHFFDTYSYITCNKSLFVYEFTDEKSVYNELSSLMLIAD